MYHRVNVRHGEYMMKWHCKTCGSSHSGSEGNAMLERKLLKLVSDQARLESLLQENLIQQERISRVLAKEDKKWTNRETKS